MPRDCSIIGFDDIELGRFTYPALSTVGQSVRALGDMAAQTLLERIAGPGRRAHPPARRGAAADYSRVDFGVHGRNAASRRRRLPRGQPLSTGVASRRRDSERLKERDVAIEGTRGKVAVMGSLNMDLVARAPRLPRPGETLAGHAFAQVAGGKGWQSGRRRGAARCAGGNDRLRRRRRERRAAARRPRSRRHRLRGARNQRFHIYPASRSSSSTTAARTRS